MCVKLCFVDYPYGLFRVYVNSTYMPTDWRKTDERLIRRGELILELSFVENYQNELDAMNHGKEGRPYKLTPTYIQFLTAFRILYGVPYR